MRSAPRGTTPGAKAARAAFDAGSADDYWNTPGVQGALGISTQLAVGILYEGLKLEDAIHHRGADRYADDAEVSAIRGAIARRKEQAKSDGFWMDAEPDGGLYVSLEDVARRAGHDWRAVVRQNGGDFIDHCGIVWYFGPGWDPFCLSWDEPKAEAAVRRYGA